MTTNITLTTGNFAAVAQGFASPVPSGLAGWFFLGGGNAAAIAKDYAFIGNAVVTGSPTYGAGFTTFGGAATNQGLLTVIPDTLDSTFVVVARSGAAFTTSPTLPTFLSTVAADSTTTPSGNKGVDFGVSGAGTGGAPDAIVKIDDWRNVSGTLTNTPLQGDFGSIANFQCMAARFTSATGNRQIDNKTGGQTFASTTANPRVVNPAQKLRIATNGAVNSGPLDMAFAGIWTRALSNTELTTVYQFVQNYLAKIYAITI